MRRTGTTRDGRVLPGSAHPLVEDAAGAGTRAAAYLIVSEDEALLVDSGAPRSADALRALLDQTDARLRFVVVTHAHPGHAGNAALMREAYGAEVIAHPLERPLLEDPGLAARIENVLRFGVEPEEFFEDFAPTAPETLLLADTRSVDVAPVPVDRELAGGERLAVGSLELEIVDLPGHTPGHIGLWNPETRSLYAGDLGVQPGPDAPYPLGDARSLVESLRRARGLGPANLLEGHGAVVEGEDAVARRLDDLLAVQGRVADAIHAGLLRSDRPLAVADLVDLALRREDHPEAAESGRWMRGEVCVQAWLRVLTDAGLAERRVERGRASWRPASARRPADVLGIAEPLGQRAGR